MDVKRMTTAQRVELLRKEVVLLRDYLAHVRDVMEEINRHTPNPIRSFSLREWRARSRNPKKAALP